MRFKLFLYLFTKAIEVLFAGNAEIISCDECEKLPTHKMAKGNYVYYGCNDHPCEEPENLFGRE